MDKFIQVNVLSWIREHIAGSAAGETVTIKIRRDSDGYWWNFSTLAFASAAASGSMTFDADGVWKASFTPPAEGTFSVWIGYGESILFHTLQAVGIPEPAAYTGTGLVTEAELESFLETSIDSTLAATLINSATDFLQRACCRIFREATFTNEYISGHGSSSIWLKNYPISSITSLTYYDRYSAADIQTLVEDRDFYLDPDTGRLECASGCWSRGMRNIRCTYVGGYATIPEDLKVLCEQLISYRINKKSVQGIDSQGIGKYNVMYVNSTYGELPPEIKAGIQRFTRVVF
jgi:hypothetical protein